MSTPDNQTVGHRKYIVVIAILSLVVVLQSVKIFMDYQDKVQSDQDLEQSSEELKKRRAELDSIKGQLEKRIAEISELGGDITELEKAKAEIEKTLNETKARSGRKITELQGMVEGYKDLLKRKDEELEELRLLNDELYSENNDLKVRQNELNDSIRRVARKNDELAGKVAIASQLRAENFRIFSVSSSGKERESPFRNRQIGKIKVTFSLAENKVAPIEGKKIFIRLLDENGQVIFDVSKGSGTFKLGGREEWFTAAQDILFDNTKQTLTFEYEKGSEYPSGNYTIEAWANDYKIGTAAFIVK